MVFAKLFSWFRFFEFLRFFMASHSCSYLALAFASALIAAPTLAQVRRAEINQGTYLAMNQSYCLLAFNRTFEACSVRNSLLLFR